MNDEPMQLASLREGLIEALRTTRAIERDVFAGLDPVLRDAPAADGGWSPKDVQAHLSAWKGRTYERLRALRVGGYEPTEVETDEANATFHAETTTDDLVAEIEQASDETIELPRISGTVMGNGSEHTLTHLAPIAEASGQETLTLQLADAITAIIDRGGWPSRPAAFARYNLACFHALSGNLDVARSLLRQALPAEAELRGYAPADDDLIALRGEMSTLAAG